jgi:GAF domain-containing protein
VNRQESPPRDSELALRDHSLLAAAKQTLEMIAGGASLPDILNNLCAAIDSQNPDIMSTALLMDPDGRRLWLAAGPRVPDLWKQALNPLVIGPDTGSCGTAAYREERVIIADVATDRCWSGLTGAQSREAALGHGIRAAWSDPVMSKDGELLGTFALYYRHPRVPSDRDLQMIEDAAHIAVIAIEGQRSREALKKALFDVKRSELQLGTIIDAIPTLAWCLHPDGRIAHVNRR